MIVNDLFFFFYASYSSVYLVLQLEAKIVGPVSKFDYDINFIRIIK